MTRGCCSASSGTPSTRCSTPSGCTSTSLALDRLPLIPYTLRRLWQFVPTLAGVVLLVFFLFNWVGGDPAYLLAGKISNPEQIENIRRQLGVDESYPTQLGIFVKQIATADFGASWATNERVSDIFRTRLGPSLTLLGMAAAMLVAYLRGSLTDRAVMIACTVGQSISILVYILIFQYLLAYRLRSEERRVGKECRS